MTTFYDQINGLVGLTPGGEPHHQLSKHIAAGDFPVTPQVLIDLVKAEDQLERDAAALEAPVESYAHWLKRTASELAEGGSMGPEQYQEGLAVMNQLESQRAHGMMIGHLRSDLQSLWKKALDEHADTLLAGLRSVLDDIKNQATVAVTGLGDLDASSVEAVAAASTAQRESIQVLTALRQRHVELVQLQQKLLRSIAEEPSKLGIPGERSWHAVFRTDLHKLKHPVAHFDTAQAHVWAGALIADAWVPEPAELASAFNSHQR